MNELALAEKLLKERRFREAEAICGKLLMQRPGNFRALHLLGLALIEKLEIERGAKVLERASQLAPREAAIWNNLGRVLGLLGRTEEAADAFANAVRLDSDYPIANHNLLYMMMFDRRYGAAEVAEARRRWGERLVRRAPSVQRQLVNRNPDRRLRVGYVSSNFRNQAVNEFFEPIVKHHSRDTIEMFCYSNTIKPDAITLRLQSYVAGWRDIAQLSDSAAATQIVRDAIDILIDIDGHMGRTRVELFARRLAPVQASYLGDQATTGLTTMDWRITDELADPPGAESFYTEKLWRLPRAFFVYMPWSDAPDVAELPAETNGLVTFGSFNHSNKLSAESVRIWSELLKKVPGSKLNVLVHDPTYQSKRLNDGFVSHGVELERVKFLRFLPTVEFLALINRTDIALDSIPFGGHTTTCDCLWMGAPVVTRVGDSYSRRMSYSVLKNLNRAELAADSDASYVEIAAALANDRLRLRELRRSLRGQMATLIDGPAFARELEAAYRGMWHGHLDSTR